MKKRYETNFLKYEKSNVYVIGIYEYIENNYKDKLLFYSMNHPTKFIFHHISEIIVELLKMDNNINYNICPMALDAKCLLYKSLQKVVSFDIKNHEPKITTLTDVESIVNLYYKTYEDIQLK